MEAARIGTREIALAGAGDEPLAGRHLPADRLHGGDRRPVLLELRADRRLRRGDEPVRLVHPDADALQPVPQARAGRGRARAESKSGFFYRMIDGGYGGVLRGALRFKPLVVLLTIAGHRQHGADRRGCMGMALIPRDDQSEYEVTVTTPEGYSLERSEQALRRARGAARKRCRGRRTSSRRSARPRAAGSSRGEGDVTRGTIYVRDEGPGATRRRTPSSRSSSEAREHASRTTPTSASASTTSRRSRAGRRPQTFQVNLAGPDSNQLAEYADELIAELKKRGRDWSTSTRRSRSASPRSR